MHSATRDPQPAPAAQRPWSKQQFFCKLILNISCKENRPNRPKLVLGACRERQTASFEWTFRGNFLLYYILCLWVYVIVKSDASWERCTVIKGLWKPVNEIAHISHLSSQPLSLVGPCKAASDSNPVHLSKSHSRPLVCLRCIYSVLAFFFLNKISRHFEICVYFFSSLNKIPRSGNAL